MKCLNKWKIEPISPVTKIIEERMNTWRRRWIGEDKREESKNCLDRGRAKVVE